MRPLESWELPVVAHLLAMAGSSLDLGAIRVEPMDDGGMGSLRFASPTHDPRLGSTPAECRFVDADGVPVYAQLNLDQAGELFELDVWKVDFTPLERWPTADLLRDPPPDSTQSTSPRPRSSRLSGKRRWADRGTRNVVSPSHAEASVPEACPACGQVLSPGLGYRHSTGPGRLGRRIGHLSGPLGLATTVSVLSFGGQAWGGYGVASACLAGVLAWAVASQVAARCPKSRRLRCKACGWQAEVTSD
jgi:hypothetical protein